MRTLRKTVISTIMALMAAVSLAFGLSSVSTTAKADAELTSSDFNVAIAVREVDAQHENGGIRFKVRIEKEKFETLMTDGVLNDGVTTGVLVTSNAIAKTLGGLTLDDKDVDGVHDLVTTGYWKAVKVDEVDYYESMIAIYSVPTEKSNVKLAVMPYITVSGETLYRNALGVASMADAVLYDGDETMRATYITANPYTVTYYDNNGTAIENGSETKYYGDTITQAKVTAPEVTGYTFDAWKNEAGTVTWAFGNDGTKVIDNTKLYAKYTINHYDVEFNRNGGSAVITQEIAYNEKAVKPSDPTKAGYTFGGWQLNGEDYDFDTPVTADIMLDAVWTPITYYATFKADDETVGESVAYTVETASITEPAVPSKEGYTGAWETYDLTTVGGITVNAVYTPIVYTATIDRVVGDDEEVKFTIEDRATVLAGITLTADTDEWDYSWTEALPEVLALNNNQVFTETRAKKTYTITWKNEDGTTLETDLAVEYGATPSYDGETPTKASDKAFSYTSSWSPAVSSVTGNAEYTVTYIPSYHDNVAEFLYEGEYDYDRVNGVYVLGEDITVTIASGQTIINTLDANLDLNGHTLTINHTETKDDYYSIFTNGITGSITNGTINYNLSAAGIPLRYQQGLLCNSNNGLIKDVTANLTVSGYGLDNEVYHVGLFGNGGNGMYDNVTVTISGTSAINGTNPGKQIGIFQAASADTVLKNCTFCLDGLPLVASNNALGLEEAFTNAGNSGNELYIMSFSGLSGLTGKVKLKNDITTGPSGYSETQIATLAADLDLNGCTLTINIPCTEQWDHRKFIDTISSTGVIRNGKIVVNYPDGQKETDGHRGILANNMNGRIEDVEIELTFGGSLTGSMVGLFYGSSSGTLENVVVRAGGTSAAAKKSYNPSGIFAGWGGSASVTLKNCIFICEGSVELYTYETWDGQHVPSLAAFTNANNSGNELVTYITDVSGLSGLTGKVKLKNDVTVTIPGYSTMINTLAAELDLNGYTLTVNVPCADDSDHRTFIGTVTETGVIRNGKIVVNYPDGQKETDGHRGILANNMNGLIKDVEIELTFGGSLTGSMVGLFHNSSSGTFEKVVVRASGSSVAYIRSYNPSGIFAGWGGSASVTLKNCIFICEGNVELYTYETWDGQHVPSLEAFTNENNDNNVYVNSVAAYTAANYITTSFNSEFWEIDGETKLPEYKLKA